MTIAEATKIRNNQDFALKKKVMSEGKKIGTIWNFDFLEWDSLYWYDGKEYRINDFCGILEVKEA